MRAFLLLLLTLLAGSAAAQDSVPLSNCKDDQVDCREECTVEYGGSTRTYDRLGACLQKCKQKYDKCRENQFKIQQRDKLGLEPESSPAAPPAGTEKPAEQSDSTRAKGVYRASEAAPEPQPEPTATPEPDKAPEPKEPKKPKPAAKSSERKPAEPEPPIDTTELDLLYDAQLPEPPAAKSKAKAKTPAEPRRSEPSPESQKENPTDLELNEK